MKITSKILNGTVIVYFNGRLDITASSDIEDMVDNIIDENPDNNLLFNLKDLEYMSSSGLKIFISVLKRFENSSNKFVISNLNSIVLKIIEIVELTDLLDIYETEEEAIKSLS